MERSCRSIASASRLAYVLLAGLALANGGCLLVAAGVAGGAAVGYSYYKGKVCQTYNASFADAVAATKTALAELGMPIIKEEDDKAKGFLESRTADGDQVRLYLDTHPSRIPAEGMLTRVCVRVATFGDQVVSERILDQVGAHLAPASLVQQGALPPPATWGPPQSVPPPGTPPPTVQPASAPPQTAPPPLLPPEPVPQR